LDLELDSLLFSKGLGQFPLFPITGVEQRNNRGEQRNNSGEPTLLLPKHRRGNARYFPVMSKSGTGAGWYPVHRNAVMIRTKVESTPPLKRAQSQLVFPGEGRRSNGWVRRDAF
jgi:hypothetical protein